MRRPALLVPVTLLALASCGGECADLASEYQTVLAASRSCEPGEADACSASVLASLDEARCPAFVDPARRPALDAVAQRYRDARCELPSSPPCPLVVGACRADAPGGPACVP